MHAWRSDGGLPWLVAAISKVEPAHPAVPDLLAAAAKVEPQSPGWATVNYHAGRGDRDQARARLDGMLADGRSALPQGTVNLLLAQRLPLAGSLDAFARDLQRLPVATSAGERSFPTTSMATWSPRGRKNRVSRASTRMACAMSTEPSRSLYAAASLTTTV